MSFLKSVEGILTTNKDTVYELLHVVDDIEEIAKELKFRANQAKRDPDDNAEAMLAYADNEFFKIETVIKKAKKALLGKES